jgi:enoyl-CoA hydratase
LTSYDHINVSREDRVAVITLARPEALNALNVKMLGELADAVATLDRDRDVGALVVTGSERAFSVGDDIKEMQPKSYLDMYEADFPPQWDALARARTPVIAAVAGLALGGGCELAMMSDILLAADTAKFGQPEIKIGVMPGMGGTQRLIRAIGKAKAMEMCLTGRMMDAHEAESAGLVARVVPAADLLGEAMATAATIAGMSLPIAMMTKEAVNSAYETTLAEGIRFERRLFHSMFSLLDQKEGMGAFIEKRPPSFRGYE